MTFWRIKYVVILARTAARGFFTNRRETEKRRQNSGFEFIPRLSRSNIAQVQLRTRARGRKVGHWVPRERRKNHKQKNALRNGRVTTHAVSGVSLMRFQDACTSDVVTDPCLAPVRPPAAQVPRDPQRVGELRLSRQRPVGPLPAAMTGTAFVACALPTH